MKRYIEYENCKICPRNCGVNRYNKTGFCKMPANLYVSHTSLHMWEEPPITGENGSGTIFFTGCNLRCVYCQNYKIAIENFGKCIDESELADIFLKLQNKGAHNINLVTPSHYILNIADAIDIAEMRGLNIPIVYNTSSYEKVESLKLLSGKIDIYLADLKYFDKKLSEKYSKAADYFEIASGAIEQMFNQVGRFEYDGELLKRGLVIRHLLLPEHIEDSKKVVKYLYDKYSDDIIFSIMSQYTPVRKLKYDNLNKRVDEREYNELVDFCIELGIENAFIQDGESATESFIPNFNVNKV
ncbi:radical SAM protein [Peptoniphilus sp. oral taxon 386]|uniref:radical SAM protein n=1 Tax=Peptoniphilus sp. oral taxon 386 TaxID=652713 RepID=UPI00159DA63F|nr:radical SAM protein [Peptoniphilus sp. oral taxon 386]